MEDYPEIKLSELSEIGASDGAFEPGDKVSIAGKTYLIVEEEK